MNGPPGGAAYRLLTCRCLMCRSPCARLIPAPPTRRKLPLACVSIAVVRVEAAGPRRAGWLMAFRLMAVGSASAVVVRAEAGVPHLAEWSGAAERRCDVSSFSAPSAQSG